MILYATINSGKLGEYARSAGTRSIEVLAQFMLRRL